MPAGSQEDDSGPPGSLLIPSDRAVLRPRQCSLSPTLPRGRGVSSASVWETSLGVGHQGIAHTAVPGQLSLTLHLSAMLWFQRPRMVPGMHMDFRVMKTWF